MSFITFYSQCLSVCRFHFGEEFHALFTALSKSFIGQVSIGDTAVALFVTRKAYFLFVYAF